MHNEWFLTGDCAYTYGCQRWVNNCGKCPQLSGALPSNRYALGGRDLTRLYLSLKRMATALVHTQRMAMVSPSRWLLNQAAKSKHLQRFSMHHIEYGLDLSVFRPKSQSACRKKLSLTAGQCLMFCVASNLDDPRKNFHSLFKLAYAGDLPEGVVLVCAGKVPAHWFNQNNPQVKWLGFLETREEMATAIAACDLSKVLSKADNLPYVCLETIACGRPVLGSNAEGIPEIISEGQTGWIIPHDASKEVLNHALHSLARLDKEILATMGRKAWDQALQRYKMDGYATNYKNEFHDLIHKCASHL